MKITDQTRAKKIRAAEFDTFMRNGILKPTDINASFYISKDSMALILNGQMTQTKEKVFCYVTVDYDTYANAVQNGTRFMYVWNGNDFEIVEDGWVEYLRKKTPKGEVFLISL